MTIARPGIMFRLAARPGSTYSTAMVTKMTSLMDEIQLSDATATLSAMVDQHVIDDDVP